MDKAKLSRCEALTVAEKQKLENINKLDEESDQVLKETCYLGNTSSSACKGLLQEAREMQNEYTKANDQYGIRTNQFDELKNAIIQGSGKDGNK